MRPNGLLGGASRRASSARRRRRSATRPSSLAGCASRRSSRRRSTAAARPATRGRALALETEPCGRVPGACRRTAAWARTIRLGDVPVGLMGESGSVYSPRNLSGLDRGFLSGFALPALLPHQAPRPAATSRRASCSPRPSISCPERAVYPPLVAGIGHGSALVNRRESRCVATPGRAHAPCRFGRFADIEAREMMKKIL